MIGTVQPANPAPPVFRSVPARAPIHRTPRQLDILGAPPHRAVPEPRRGGIDVRA